MEIKTCKTCGNQETWSSQKIQYKRLIQKNYSKDQIKAALPRCHKCITQWIDANSVVTVATIATC